MWLERISGGAVDLIELDDAKDHLRLLEDDFDVEVQRAISAASAYLDVDSDGFGGLSFPLVNQQWSSRARGFIPSVLRLPFSRITAIDEIRFISPEGAAETVAPDHYIKVKSGRDTLIHLLSGKVWPSVADRPDAVDVRFTAGFEDVDSVPGDIKSAARLLIGHFFHNREAAAAGDVPQEIALGVERLVGRYRRFVV